MATLKLPFDFPPNTTPATHQLQANFNALLKFVQDINNAVETFTSLSVETLDVTDAATVANDLTAGSVDASGAVSAGSVAATGTVAGNALSATTSVAATSASLSGWMNVPAIAVGGTSGEASTLPDGELTVASSAKVPQLSVDFVGGSSSLTVTASAFDGTITQPLQPSFLVYVTADTAGVTGDGTEYTIDDFTEIYDQGGDFSSGSTFTAPIGGKYLFTGQISIADCQTTVFPLRIVTSNRTYTHDVEANAGNIGVVRFAVLADMDSGDTAYITVDDPTGADGNPATKDAYVQGSGGLYTYWSGSLVN